MRPSTKCSFTPKPKTSYLPLLFIVAASLSGAFLFNDAEPYVNMTFVSDAKEACVINPHAHEQNEQKQVCGTIVSFK